MITAPERISVASGLPCLIGGQLTVGLTNTSKKDVYADLDLTVSEPMTLSRHAFSSYLPATDPDQTVSTDVQVTTPVDLAPGSYRVFLSVQGQDRREVYVDVEELDAGPPNGNLAYGQQAFASSTHTNVKLCGGVDGNTDSSGWGVGGTHDATRGVFPDHYGVTLAEATTVGRVEIYTLDSERYPAARMGIRDFDIQVHTTQGWQTVKSVTGNEVGHIVATFDPVVADQVRVVVHDTNDHGYSRIVELEAYAS
ncbi:discoidin domain-containing protein [Propionibacteriaceae bacterium Y2011]